MSHGLLQYSKRSPKTTSFSCTCDCGRPGIMNLEKNRFVCSKSMCTKQYSMVNKYNLIRNQKKWGSSLKSTTTIKKKLEQANQPYECVHPEFRPQAPRMEFHQDLTQGWSTPGTTRIELTTPGTIIPDEPPFGYRYLYQLEWEKQSRFILGDIPYM